MLLDLAILPNAGDSLMDEQALDDFSKPNTPIVAGLCSRGPYSHAIKLIRNPEVKWIAWGYGHEYIHPSVLREIGMKKITHGSTVLFAAWDLARENQGTLLRVGRIDHLAHRPGYTSLTVFLGEPVEGSLVLPEIDHFLLRHIEIQRIRIARPVRRSIGSHAIRR